MPCCWGPWVGIQRVSAVGLLLLVPTPCPGAGIASPAVFRLLVASAASSFSAGRAGLQFSSCPFREVFPTPRC